MKHPSQIFTSRTYKVLDNLEQLKGKTVVDVFDLEDDAMAIVTEGAILIISKDGVILEKDTLYTSEFELLEERTAITKDQLL